MCSVKTSCRRHKYDDAICTYLFTMILPGVYFLLSCSGASWGFVFTIKRRLRPSVGAYKVLTLCTLSRVYTISLVWNCLTYLYNSLLYTLTEISYLSLITQTHTGTHEHTASYTHCGGRQKRLTLFESHSTAVQIFEVCLRTFSG